MSKSVIRDILLKNAKDKSIEYEQEIKMWENLVLAKKELFIPGYIPYIGKNYLNVKTKIMVYALSQDIYPDDELIIQFADNWKNKQNITESLDRQNISFRDKKEVIQMRPFDTGHLPILSGILIFLISKKNELNPIDDISATNLSKFSFRNQRNRTTDNEKSLNKCFCWFSQQELNILRPDYIICAGNRVFNIMKKNIDKLNINSKPIKVKFPSLQVINRYYRKNLTDNYAKTLENIISIFSKDFLIRNVTYKNKRIIDIIHRDAYYFIEMYKLMESQIENLAGVRL